MDHHSPHPTIPTSSAKRFFFATLHGSEGSMARTAVSAQRRPFSTSQRLGQGEEWTWPTWNYSCDKLKDVIIVFVCVLMRVSIKKWVGYNLWMNWKGQSKEWCWMMFGLCLDHHWCWDDNPKCLGSVCSLAILWLRQLPLALAVASWTRAEVSCSAWWSVQAAQRYHKPGPEAHILDETKPLGTGAIWKQLSISI